MNRLEGTATLVFKGRTYQLIGLEAPRIAQQMADADYRIEIVEPIKWPVSIKMSLQMREEAGRWLNDWIDKIKAECVEPVRQAPEKRRRAQWKDEQSRYGRRR